MVERRHRLPGFAVPFLPVEAGSHIERVTVGQERGRAQGVFDRDRQGMFTRHVVWRQGNLVRLRPILVLGRDGIQRLAIPKHLARAQGSNGQSVRTGMGWQSESLLEQDDFLGPAPGIDAERPFPPDPRRPMLRHQQPHGRGVHPEFAVQKSATATTPRLPNPSVSQRRQGESVSSDLLGFRLSIGIAS